METGNPDFNPFTSLNPKPHLCARLQPPYGSYTCAMPVRTSLWAVGVWGLGFRFGRKLGGGGGAPQTSEEK